MSNWISSKLRVAETFFEQIDQQAAESLKKNEATRSEDLKLDVRARSGGAVPLKDQLKKKKSSPSSPDEGIRSEFLGRRNSDPVVGSGNDSGKSNGVKEVSIPVKPKPTLTDSDWTELLGNPNPPSTSSHRGAAGIRGLRKDFRRQVSSEGKRNVKASGNLDKRRLDAVLGNRIVVKPSDGEEESSSSARSSNVEYERKVFDSKEVESKALGESEGNGGWQFQSEEILDSAVSGKGGKDQHVDVSPLSQSQSVDGVPDVKKGAGGVYDRLRSTVKSKHKPAAASKSSASDDLKRGLYSSDGGSDSESESGSSSDSEDERERERRKKILAEKAIAKAAEAVKERENYVARLEGEKQSLEKILEERAKLAAEEASELQTTTMETMEAADVEKQKHKNTRMEALARLAKLESANADLSRSLATVQKNLETESSQVAGLRQEVEFKEAAVEEFKRKISGSSQQAISHINQSGASKGVEFEREILETECSFLTDKIRRLEDKAKKLEADIEVTRKDLEEPTEVEVELKRRLGQLTDHLIQKQAQVEALSSEKATLVFRIEAVTRSLEENKSAASSSDLESGTWGQRTNERRMAFEEKLRSGRKHLGSLLEQLDAIFVAGAVFLRRNPSGKLWAGAYLVCLHFWVVYILMSQSGTTPPEGRSGAVISLENINNTGAV